MSDILEYDWKRLLFGSRALENFFSFFGAHGFVNLFDEFFSDSAGPATNLIIDKLNVLFTFIHFIELDLQNWDFMRKL